MFRYLGGTMGTSGGVQTIERKVYFYRLQVVGNPPQPQFDAVVAAQLINELSSSGDQRYLDIEDSNLLCAWSISTAGNVKLQLGIIRRSGLPDIEEAGVITPLSILDTQGLVETVHIVFFPHNIVGAEFNFYGPRVSRLSTYLRAKFPSNLPPISLAILLRQDVQQQLAHLRAIRIAHLRLHRSHFELARQADENLFQAFRAAAAAAEGATSVEIILRPERYSRVTLGGRFLDSIKRLAGLSDIREAAELFKIRALDDRLEKYEWMDLLRDQLVTSRDVLKLPGRQRGVDSDAMFRIIEEAYAELRDQLERAAGADT